MTVQLFDQRAETQKANACFSGVSDYLHAERVNLFSYAYDTWPLADMLYGTVPVSKAMTLAIWRECFAGIVSSLGVAGTYEHYLTMIRGIFNIDAVVTFTILSAGSLKISIDVTSGQGLTLSTWTTDDSVEMITDALDTLVFARVLETIDTRDLANVLKATAPAGITVTFEIISA